LPSSSTPGRPAASAAFLQTAVESRVKPESRIAIVTPVPIVWYLLHASPALIILRAHAVSASPVSEAPPRLPPTFTAPPFTIEAIALVGIGSIPPAPRFNWPYPGGV